MNIYRDISEINKTGKSVVTIGSFDGIHIGHADIIGFVINEAAAVKGENFVVTFEPHPRLVVSKNSGIKILTAFEEKAKLFENLGVQNLLVINFNREFADLSYEDFVKTYLTGKINAGHIVIGHDHHFGRGRGGDENKLLRLSQEMNFKLTVIPPVSVKGIQVSSSKVREAVAEGNLTLAEDLLGRKYSLSGMIVEGVQRGRELGFPTANIEPCNKHKLIPASGVYAVKCILGNGNYNGVLNIGTRPTFETQDNIFIELHIFGFGENIYGKPVEIEFVHRIREEIKFGSKEQLILQIKSDVETAKQILINN